MIQPLPVVANKPIIKYKPTTNGFARGNCTYYVALRRAKMGKPVTWRGNAGMWFENAKKQGYAVGARPMVGAIYVTRRESSRGSNLGHVAIIEKIVGDKMLLTEMNYTGFNKVSSRWVPVNKTGVGYIY